jgi:hypothetical protein
MKSRIFSVLDPFGPFSPLNPRNPAHPLSTFARERQPPLDALDDDHSSLLKKLYGDRRLENVFGDGVWLENVPFPNMEWWWNAIHCNATVKEEIHQLSILTNVQLFAIPFIGWVAQGTLAIRDLVTAKTWKFHIQGELSADSRCRFSANGWTLGRNLDEERYHVDIDTDDVTADFRLNQGPAAFFGDSNLPKGWADNNPKGFIPYWASYRSRFGSPEGGGRIVLSDLEYKLTGEGHARFDHQSLHWSPKDIGGLSPAILAEAFITRPQWLWYHASFEDRAGLFLTAYQLRNGQTGKVIKAAGALCDREGFVRNIEPRTLIFKARDRSRNRLPGIEFDAPREAKWKLSGGQSSLDFAFNDSLDWTVLYPIVGPLRYRAEEACGKVTGNVAGRAVEGPILREILDLVRSIGV